MSRFGEFGREAGNEKPGPQDGTRDAGPVGARRGVIAGSANVGMGGLRRGDDAVCAWAALFLVGDEPGGLRAAALRWGKPGAGGALHLDEMLALGLLPEI